MGAAGCHGNRLWRQEMMPAAVERRELQQQPGGRGRTQSQVRQHAGHFLGARVASIQHQFTPGLTPEHGLRLENTWSRSLQAKPVVCSKYLTVMDFSLEPEVDTMQTQTEPYDQQ